ncbi:MAG: precorrin-3B C(17)-methyltransferase [Acidobacteriia bacterium]|nr:precorrin-3B C(17)-methyltransferase [Methyloceanibacter sp.]MCL6492084.1 precorrin-3B C(17)-methyltransferase [Terriglobia bacterium]
MTGALAIVSLGPGAPGLITPDAAKALAEATDLVGYGPYLARLQPAPEQRLHAFDNRTELARAELALRLAAGGRRVALVSSGDAGVFAMAATTFEAMEKGEPSWRGLALTVIPGISAALAAAARLGAPLGGDFCVISLSDYLKPWPVIAKRLRAAAEAGFVLALYNPASAARPWQLGAAFATLREVLAGTTPVAFATNVSLAEERLTLASLATADPALAGMRTLVLIGAPTSRLIPRPAGLPWFYTPRGLPSL